MDLASFLSHLPLSTQRFTMHFRFEQSSGRAFLNFNTKRWEETRMGLDRLSNLTTLAFVVWDDLQLMRSSTDINSKVFNDRLRAILERELPA